MLELDKNMFLRLRNLQKALPVLWFCGIRLA